MKRLIAGFVSLMLVMSIMVVPVSAASPDGSAGNPFTKIPNTTISGGVPARASGNTTTRGGTELSIVDNETAVVAGNLIISNKLSAPTKGTVRTIIYVTSTGTGTLKINNSTIESFSSAPTAAEVSYSFSTGETYEILYDATDAADDLYWEFTVPDSESNPPTLTVSGTNGTLEETSAGVIVSDQGNTLSRQLTFTLDDATGIEKFTVVNYTNDKFTTVKPGSDSVFVYMRTPEEITIGGYTIDSSDVYTIPTTSNLYFTVDGNSSYATKWTNQRTFSNGNEYLMITAWDIFGNQSQFKVLVTGMTGVNDSSAPDVSLGQITKSTDSNGTVTSITGSIIISDSPAGLASVNITQSGVTNPIANFTGMNGQSSHTQNFTMTSAQGKSFTVVATDQNGNTANKVLDLSNQFTTGGGDNGGGNDNAKPTISLSSTTPTTSGGVVTQVVAAFAMADADDGMSNIKILNGTNVLVDQALNGEKAKNYNVTLASTLASKQITVTVKDVAGQVTTNTWDFSSYFTGGDSGGTAKKQITSSSDLKKAIKDATWEFSDVDETIMSIQIDPDYLPASGQFTWTLKDGSDELDDGTGTAYEYVFTDGDEDAGTYRLKVEYTYTPSGGSKKTLTTTVSLDVEYRDVDNDVARALTVKRSYDGTSSVALKMSLDKDILDSTSSAKWTLPNGTVETGRTVTYTVTKNGTYKFIVRCDGESYTYTAKVTDLDGTGTVSDGSGNSGGNGGATVDEKPTNGGSVGGNNTGGTEYKGSNAPIPGTGLVSGITTSTQQITIPLSNWDKNVWHIMPSSMPSGVTYVETDSSIVFTVPNSSFTMSFKLVNSSNEFVTYNFPVTTLKTDGTSQVGNSKTGGVAGGASGTGGVGSTAAMPLSNFRVASQRKTKIDDSDID